MERVCHRSFQRHQRRPRSGHPASAPESWGSHEHYDQCLQHCSRSCATAVHQWQLLAYFSKNLKPAETRYSPYDRELLAIYMAIKHF